MALPKSAVPLIGATLFIALGALAIHFLATGANALQALTKTYTNSAWGFMLKMPADFSAYPPNATPERDATGAPRVQVIALQNTAGAAVQIMIMQDSRETADANVFTASDVQQLAPYLDFREAQPFQIGHGITGVTFMDTDQPPLGSATDEVWFAYRGNLYQVIADAKFDALLKSMLATWTFI
jgi:hypothetical protein